MTDLLSNSALEGSESPRPHAITVVQEYLQREFLGGTAKEGTRLPPVRALAAQLGVPPSTVYSAYRTLQEDGFAVASVGRGTFLKPRQNAGIEPPARLCIALSVSEGIPPDHGPWGAEIVHHLFTSAARCKTRVSILPLSCDSLDYDAKTRFLLAEVDEVDALILFPALNAADLVLSKKVTAYYAARRKPVLQINAPSIQSTTNFVSADFFASTQTVAQSWLETGRRRIAYLGPAHPGVSALQRLSGIQASVMGFPDAAPPRFIVSTGVDERAGEVAMQKVILSGEPLPDAIFAFGDLLGIGAWRALEASGIPVPDEVSLVGGTGMRSSPDGLSATPQPFGKMGDALIATIVESLSLKGREMPGIFLNSPFSAGCTSRPEETAVCRRIENQLHSTP